MKYCIFKINKYKKLKKANNFEIALGEYKYLINSLNGNMDVIGSS